MRANPGEDTATAIGVESSLLVRKFKVLMA